VSELAAGVDPLEVDGLLGSGGGLGDEGLAEGDDALDDAWNGALEHNPILSDDTVVGEASEGGDTLGGEIVVGLSGLIDDLSVVELLGAVDLVDLLVDLSTVMVTVLTSAGDGVLHARRMPGTNAGNLAETLVGLTGETGGSPTGGDTLESLTLGDGDDVDHLVLLEDASDGDLVLEELDGEVDLLLSVGTSVDLDLNDVGLLLAELEVADLGVGDETDDVGALVNALKLTLSGGTESLILLNSGVVLGESELLGLVPLFFQACASVSCCSSCCERT
jgi:hypothetical protein